MRVFCASLADVFEDWQGVIHDHKGNVLMTPEIVWDPDPRPTGREVAMSMQDLRRELFEGLIDKTPWLDWMLLTKRPENIGRFWPPTGRGVRRDNVWLGTSVSDQETWDEFVPDLLRHRSHCNVTFVSAEPLLGPITMRREVPDWLIIGGESGPGARECRVEWIEDLVDQGQRRGIATFVKQLGADPRKVISTLLCDLNLKDRKGGDISEWPEPIQVRETPGV